MANQDKAPDSVTHSREFVIAPRESPWVEKTVIHDGDKTSTGYGWTVDEANKNAGEKRNKGK
ncbi:MAG: hypothetical protein ACYCOU_20775 [Sulfobacillus sp.]